MSEKKKNLLGCCVSPNDIALAASNGFDFVELQVGSLMPELDKYTVIDIQAMLFRSEIPVLSFNAFLPPHLHIVGEDINRRELERYVVNTMERIDALGGRRVSFGSGASRSCPDGFSLEKAKGQILDFVELTCTVGEAFDVEVNVEALNRSECNMINSLQQASEYVEKLALSNLGLLADFYHMQMEKASLSDIGKYRKWLKYVHVADTGRLYPGSGNYPFTELASILKDADYTGPISVECNWRDPKTEIPLASKFLKKIL